MLKEIEKQINDSSLGKVVKLKGKMNLDFTMDNSFTVGHLPFKSIIGIKRSGVIIDGSEAEIVINIKETFKGDWSLFYLYPNASNVELRNLTIKVIINNSIHCTRMFAVIYNTAFGLKINNCHIELYSNKQINLYGVYSNGNLDTHFSTRADNLVVNNSTIKVECLSEEYLGYCFTYGLYNNLSNSISIQNNFIYSINRGIGEKQRAVGLFTNGRYGRFVGNNIKANCNHPEGLELERAHAYGFINVGSFSVITGNNIIGEWAGKAIGLETTGEFALITSNKISSSHTICGRTLINNSNKVHIENNVLISTSRNAIVVVNNANNVIICHNIVEIMMYETECLSGCGIYCIGKNLEGNIVSENIIYNVLNCGLFIDKNIGTVNNNLIYSYPETIKISDSSNQLLMKKFSEKMIFSLKK